MIVHCLQFENLCIFSVVFLFCVETSKKLKSSALSKIGFCLHSFDPIFCICYFKMRSISTSGLFPSLQRSVRPLPGFLTKNLQHVSLYLNFFFTLFSVIFCFNLSSCLFSRLFEMCPLIKKNKFLSEF